MQGHPEDFISRSSHKVLYKIMQDCISLGSPQGLLTGTGTRSCKDFLDDFSRISTRSSDLCKGGFRPDPHKIFAYGAVLDNARTSWREANQDLHKIFSQGPVQDHAGSPQDLLKDLHESPILLHARFVRACAWTVQKNHFMRELSGNHAAPQDCDNRFARACAVEMHLDISEEPFYAIIYKENVAPWTGTKCEPARSKCTWTSQKNLFMREFTAKLTAQTLRGPAQSKCTKCTWTCH